MALMLTSPAFANNGAIPTVHLRGHRHRRSTILAPEEKRKSLALIIDDPDAPDPRAPKITWVHWVVYNIPADANGLAEGAAKSGPPAGAQLGLNDWKRADYGGPCPPIGRHRYFHKLYALDTVLPDLGHARKRGFWMR
jgi:Raf kinase inhibitor-like YbhB/YbcL family protein